MSRVASFGQISEITAYLYLSGVHVLKADLVKKRRIACVINATAVDDTLAAAAAPITPLNGGSGGGSGGCGGGSSSSASSSSAATLLTSNVNHYVPPGVEYVKVRVDDSPTAHIYPHFDPVADKINGVKQRGYKTLVHCVAGVSRSATLCIAYLVKYENMALRDAYYCVKQARPIIRPNQGFWVQLIEYERKIRGENTVTMVMSNFYGQEKAIPDVYLDEQKLVPVNPLKNRSSTSWTLLGSNNNNHRHGTSKNCNHNNNNNNSNSSNYSSSLCCSQASLWNRTKNYCGNNGKHAGNGHNSCTGGVNNNVVNNNNGIMMMGNIYSTPDDYRRFSTTSSCSSSAKSLSLNSSPSSNLASRLASRYGNGVSQNNGNSRRMTSPAAHTFSALTLANSVVPLKAKVKASLFNTLYDTGVYPTMNDILFPTF